MRVDEHNIDEIAPLLDRLLDLARKKLETGNSKLDRNELDSLLAIEYIFQVSSLMVS